MIELESIKQIKSPSLENVIIFALRCANYMIINDKLNGLIVLDLEWREVNRIYIGEQLLLIEAIYTDVVRNRIVFKLESSLCFVDIDAHFVKIIPIPNNIKEFYFYQLYKFSDDIILMRTNKGVVSLSLIDYSVRIIDEIADYDEKFAYFVYESEIKESFLHNGKLVCLDTNNITILDDKYGLAVAENQLQIFNLNGDIKSKILSYKRPWYGGRADIVEKDDGLHLYVISRNDLDELTSLSEYVMPFDKMPNHVVLL
ncbi:MAG: hypothetical protein E7E89_06425 [Veillonella sp.]|nr:hypothetical protein [Veillonella sp.]